MENRRNMKEEIKIQVDPKNIHESEINSRIYKYTMTKYKNILNEEGLIKDILVHCRESDEEIKQRYLNELKQLEEEKWIVFNKIQEMDNEEDIEK